MRFRLLGHALLLALAFAVSPLAQAHSASDAYLTLAVDAQNTRVLHGQWDIAIRDLDFLLALDDDGDGKVSWGEVRRHLPAIERYAYGHLGFGTCAVTPVRALIDDHADGAYVVLIFDVSCTAKSSPKMNYGLFFEIDPSHRGIFLLRSRSGTSTALLSPQNASVTLGAGQ